MRGWDFCSLRLRSITPAFCPKGGEERATHTVREAAKTFGDVVVTFFQKRNILLLLFFIFLYRAGEGQVIKVGPLFLSAARETGGLGLTMQKVGAIYGTFGSGGFHSGQHSGRIFHGEARIEACAHVADPDPEFADVGVLVSERGIADQSRCW